MSPDARQLSEQIRTALLNAAVTAYDEAALQGLCAEGAWEVAVGAMRTLDLSDILAQAPVHRGDRGSARAG
jgi:hypothetical protein